MPSIPSNLFQDGPVIILRIIDKPGWPLSYVSANIEHVLGYPAEEFISKKRSLLDIILPDENEGVGEVFSKAQREKTRFLQVNEVRLLHRNGEVRYLSFHLYGQVSRDDAPFALHGYAVDHSEEKQALRGLRKTEMRWCHALEASRIGVWDWIVQTGEVFFSAGWKRMLGYEEDEIGNSVSEWETRVHPDDKDATLRAVHGHLDGATPYYESIHRVRCKDGRYKWILDRGKVIERDNRGNAVRILGTHSDFSAYKEMEDRLRNEEERLRAILQTTMDGFFVVDTQGKFKDANEAYCKQVEYSKEELLLKGIGDVEALETAEDTANHIKEIIQTGSDRFHTKHRKKHGGAIDFEISVNYLELDGGIFVVFTRDITEKIISENALKESEQRFRQLAENIDEVFWLRTDDRVLYVSPAYEQIWGRSCQSLYDNPNSFLESVHPDDKNRIIAAFAGERHRVQGHFDEEYRIVRPEGTVRWVWARSFPITEETAEADRRAGIAQDITKRKEAEYDLINAKEKAELANRAKSEFLANMSHEIRTPMNSILGFTETLIERLEAMPELQHYSKNIHNSGKTLLQLIDDILDLSKIEAGRLEIQSHPTNLRSLIEEIYTIFALKIQEKNLEFSVHFDSSVPAGIYLDESRVRQILFNLLGNAVKFTDTGSVGIEIHCSSIQEGSADIHIAVHDTGIGIPRSQQELIFEPFRQQEGQSGRLYGGTGLGLSISKRLTELMGGSLTVESEQGEGSVFTLFLPGTKITEKPPKPPTPEKAHTIIFNPALVLVVEDLKPNREVVRTFLEETGLTLLEAEDGQRGLEMVRTKKPDLVLMDLRMPVMDGYQATHIIKTDEGTNHIPVIALTASAMKSERERIRKQFDGYLQKPVKKSVLLHELSRFLSHTITEENNAESQQSTWEEELQRFLKTETIDKKTVIEHVRNTIIPAVQTLTTSIAIDTASKLADELIVLGKQHSLPEIVTMGDRIKTDVDTVDIADLHELIKQLRKIERMIQ